MRRIARTRQVLLQRPHPRRRGEDVQVTRQLPHDVRGRGLPRRRRALACGACTACDWSYRKHLHAALHYSRVVPQSCPRLPPSLLIHRGARALRDAMTVAMPRAPPEVGRQCRHTTYRQVRLLPRRRREGLVVRRDALRTGRRRRLPRRRKLRGRHGQQRASARLSPMYYRATLVGVQGGACVS